MKPVTTKQTITYYLTHVRRYPLLAIGALSAMPLAVIVGQYIPPLIVAHSLNKLTTQHINHDALWSTFGPAIIMFALFSFLSGAVMYRIVDSFVWRLEASVVRSLYQQVYWHLLDQSMSFHADNFGGSLVSQTSKLAGSYVRIADTTIYQVIPLITSIVLTTIILLPQAPLYVGVLLLFAMIYITTASLATKPVRNISAKLAASESRQTGYIADSVTNILTIKSFAHNKYEKKHFGSITDRNYNYILDIMRAHNKSQIYFSTIVAATNGAAFAMAIVSVVVFSTSIGTAFLILSYTSSIITQLLSFSNSSLKSYNRALGDAADMVGILDIEPSIKDSIKPETSRITDGSITFNDVSFTHGSQEDALFEKLNLQIKPGEKVGLVGSSGSGKTTLTRLLLRFSDIDDGEILVDNQNIAKIRQDDLRSKMAYVAQEPLLFHRSLRENIRYGQLTASDEEVEAIAKLAHADDFIKLLPQGYDTLVGERGVKLSGGQRQRIAIARAMLKDAPILLLDEATSALDSESEVLIQDALWKLMEGRTAIVIAHRLSTIQKMDRIIVLDNGAIVEQGTHQQLLKKKSGTYAMLWNHQSGGFIEE